LKKRLELYTNPQQDNRTMKNKTVKTHTAKVDNYIPVIALDSNGRLCLDYYGTFGTGAYLLEDEVVAALKTHEERTDEDRVNFMEDYAYEIQYSSSLGHYPLLDNEEVFAGGSNFRTWREAVDALMDMEDAG
jgi:hypothetical protein